MKLNIIDCTLRDGGYYNNWDFNIDLANKYLHVMREANVDVVEIGYRFAPQSVYKGPFAYTTENLIKLLDVPENGPQLAIMLDEKDVSNCEFGWELFVSKFVSHSNDSKVSYIGLLFIMTGF